MRLNLRSIEKRFDSERNKLLKKFQSIEQKKKSQYSRVDSEFQKYRKREALLKRLEAGTSAHLRQINRRIGQMRKQDLYDKKRIRQLVAEIKHLKKEIPSLEKSVRKMKPVRKIAARKESIVSRHLRSVSSKAAAIDKKRNAVLRELNALLQKEKMLREGRIYWHAAKAKIAPKRKRAKPKPKQTPVQKKEPGFLAKILGTEK